MKPNHSEKRKRSILRDRPVVLAISVLVLVLGIVGTTLGFLVDQTTPVKNTFIPAKTGITVDEKLENGVKNDVKIKNTSDFDVFIRARVIVTWKDENGNVSATAPVAGTDYEITWRVFPNVETRNWVYYLNGGYYLYTVPVAANASTDILFTGCKPVEGKTPEGYHLSVEIIADCIQAHPASAIQEAWGITVNAAGLDLTSSGSDSQEGGNEQ